MAKSTELTVARRRSPLVAMPTAEDRAVAFRRARRHSRLVRFLRIGLPVTAVALFATYGISVRMTVTDNSGGMLKVSLPSLIGEDLTMNNPEYQGYNKDGSRYVVRAETARQDIRQTGPVRLDTINARLTQPDNTVTVVDARRGDYETKSGVLKAFDGIDIVSQNGMKARLSTAIVSTKEGTVVSNDPVLITMPTGQLRGNRLELRQKVREATFLDGVAARLLPEQKPPKADPAAPPSSTKQAAEPANLLAASNAPVDIESDRLDLDDNRKIALFRGSVKAVQGDSTLVAPELEVHYANAAAPGTPPAPAPAAAPAQSPQGRLERMIARTDITLTRGADVVQAREATFEQASGMATLVGNVVITSPPDRRVTGDRADIHTPTSKIRLAGNVNITAGADRQATADVADIDQKADTAVLTGRAVVVTQGQNILRGTRMTMDRKAGTSEMTTPGGRITAHFVRAEQKPAADEAKAQKAAPAFGTISFSTDPNAPIDLESDNLQINDTAKTATFRGDVRVVQGDFVIRTPELVANYTGQASVADAAAAPKGAAKKEKGAEAEAAQLRNLRANRKVVITSKDNQSVKGDWALFDVKANTVTVGGEVVVSQGRNIITGPRLVIDMITGQSRMEQLAGAATAEAASAPTTADGPPAHFVTGGRVGGIFFPQDAKELKEKRAKESAGDGANKKTPVVRREPSTSGWNVETAPQGTGVERQ